MRRAGTIIAMVVVAIIAAIDIFLTTIDINRYRGSVQDDLTKRPGRKVTLGEMHLSVIPFRFVAHDVSIADEPAFRTEKPFLQAQELGVSARCDPAPSQRRVAGCTVDGQSLRGYSLRQGNWSGHPQP
jgi:AsmA protein